MFIRRGAVTVILSFFYLFGAFGGLRMGGIAVCGWDGISGVEVGRKDPGVDWNGMPDWTDRTEGERARRTRTGRTR